MVNPQSIINRVLPLSTTSPLPELPLPSEANRITPPYRGLVRRR
jgi:hypothetical protein